MYQYPGRLRLDLTVSRRLRARRHSTLFVIIWCADSKPCAAIGERDALTHIAPYRDRNLAPRKHPRKHNCAIQGLASFYGQTRALEKLHKYMRQYASICNLKVVMGDVT